MVMVWKKRLLGLKERLLISMKKRGWEEGEQEKRKYLGLQIYRLFYYSLEMSWVIKNDTEDKGRERKKEKLM